MAVGSRCSPSGGSGRRHPTGGHQSRRGGEPTGRTPPITELAARCARSSNSRSRPFPASSAACKTLPVPRPPAPFRQQIPAHAGQPLIPLQCRLLRSRSTMTSPPPASAMPTATARFNSMTGDGDTSRQRPIQRRCAASQIPLRRAPSHGRPRSPPAVQPPAALRRRELAPAPAPPARAGSATVPAPAVPGPSAGMGRPSASCAAMREACSSISATRPCTSAPAARSPPACGPGAALPAPAPAASSRCRRSRCSPR